MLCYIHVLCALVCWCICLPCVLTVVIMDKWSDDSACVVVVCHDQVRRQVSQGFRCRGS